MRLSQLNENSAFDNDIIEFEFGDLVIEAQLLGIDNDGNPTVQFDEQGLAYFDQASDMLNEALPALAIPAAVATARAAAPALARAAGRVASKLIKRTPKKAKPKKSNKPASASRSARRRATDMFGGGSDDSRYNDPLQTAVGKFAAEDVSESIDQNEIVKLLKDLDDDMNMNRHYGDVDTNKFVQLVQAGNFEDAADYAIGEYHDDDGGQDDSVLQGAYEDMISDLQYMSGQMSEAEYQGRKVKLNKPMRGDVKKFKVYVKDPKTGNVKKVNFGHKGKGNEKTMRIKKSDPKRRKSFRARHNCDNPGPKTKARYWSCRMW